MLRNISIMRKKRASIKPEWLRIAVLQHPDIPSKVYKLLKINIENQDGDQPFNENVFLATHES